MVISRPTSPGWWVLALVALHLACAHGIGPQEASLELLDDTTPAQTAPRALTEMPLSRLSRLIQQKLHREQAHLRELGETDRVYLDMGQQNSTDGSAGQGNTTAPAGDGPLEKTLSKMQAKKERAETKALAKATADEAKEKARITKKILDQSTKRQKKVAKAVKKEETDVENNGKSKNGTNTDALSSVQEKIRKEALTRLYSQHVLIAEKAKEYSHKVTLGSKEAAKAGATVAQMREQALQKMPHNVGDEVNERIVKAKARLAAQGDTGTKPAAAGAPASAAQMTAIAAAPAAALTPDANGEEEPAAKQALKQAVAAAKSKPTPEALSKVKALTSQLKSASAHDKNVEKVATNEMDAKIKNVKQDTALKAKAAELADDKAKQAKEEKVLEEKKELAALEAENESPKIDAKLEKKLEKAKAKVQKKKLKEQLMETEAKAARENAKLKEQEEAKNIKAKEVDQKASVRANELEEKKRGEKREMEEKKVIVDKAKAKERADEDRRRLKKLQAKLSENTANLKEKINKENKKVTDVIRLENKADDEDMTKMIEVSGDTLKKDLAKQEKVVAAKAKKAVQEAKDDAADEKKKLEKEVDKLEKRLAKDKNKIVASEAKAANLKARDEAQLANARTEQKKHEDEKYKEELASKRYRENLKLKLVMELKEEVRQEVYGPYKEKLKAKLKAELTSELKRKLKLETRMAGAMKDLNKESQAVKNNLEAIKKDNAQVKAHNILELGDTSSQSEDVTKVRRLAYAAAADAATRAAHAAEKQVEDSVQSNRDNKRQAFSWDTQRDYWARDDALKVEEEAAAKGARAAVKDRAARSAVKHLINTLDKADGVYDAKKKSEAGFYIKDPQATVSKPAAYVAKDGWEMKSGSN